jgi:hypothetical protein
MLSVTNIDCHTKAPYAECHYVECRYAECHSAVYFQKFFCTYCVKMGFFLIFENIFRFKRLSKITLGLKIIILVDNLMLVNSCLRYSLVFCT